MASDTVTKKSRWLRLGAPRRPEFNQFFDLYWGGPERRITGLTLRIIGVNAVALLILVFGMLYLSQYQSTLIENKLETFKTEAELVAASISEDNSLEMMSHLSRITSQRIRLFNAQGTLISDTGGLAQTERHKGLTSVQILKNMASVIIDVLPKRSALPAYPQPATSNGNDYPDVTDALNGEISLSAWHMDEGKVFLSAAAPIQKDGNVRGAVLLTRYGADIEEAIGNFWLDILKMFLFTLVITILLSIYLSGVIARPLRKLARAAEDVRSGNADHTDIPDLSYRHDEIGELSLVLRDMTSALWERMDSIESFAADVSHELKNPLTSLRSAIETLAVVKTQADKDKLIGIIMHDLERMDRLISDISNASRIEAELSREEFQRINLHKLLTHLIDIYKRQNKHHAGIFLECGTDIEVLGVESRLMQVFENLLSNAVSFSPEGGTISIRVMPAKQRIAIMIEDEGAGIPQGKLETIFERFYSERPKHEDYGRHSGLGLSIAKQIVEAHNGMIYAENLRNGAGQIRGARLTVMLQPA